MDPEITVVITTKNRKDELRNAMASALSQSTPLKVLVIDDGSSDGTFEMVKKEFPQVRVERSEQSLGLIAQRNRAATLVDTPYLISIDDDAVFISPNTVEQTLADFADSRIGAVAMPYIDVKYGPDVRQKAPDNRNVWVTSDYRGTAHALRREIFIKAGGYHSFFIHQAEEADFSLRLLNEGFYVRLGRADPIHHLESPKRDFSRVAYYGSRNYVLSAWCNTPALYLIPNIVVSGLRNLRAGLRAGLFGKSLAGLWSGLIGCVLYFHERRPVRMEAFRSFRKLRAKPKCLDSVADASEMAPQ